MTTAPSTRLDGLSVLVTRPEPQAAVLGRRIEEVGGRPLLFPALRIEPVSGSSRLARAFDRLAGYSLVVFVSTNAVELGLPLIAAAGGVSPAARVAGVGRATGRALSEAGLQQVVVPQTGFDSEALLAMPVFLQVAGKRVLIVRGEGGRSLLGDTLRERGAVVTYAEVYRRVCPQERASELLHLWSEVDVVVATSNEILDNLLCLGKSAESALQDKPLLVISARMAEHARSLGFRRLVQAEHAADEAVLEALVRFRQAIPGRA